MTIYKGYIIRTNPAFPTLYTVAVEGRGGKIPRALEGNFTSVATVTEIIDKYKEVRRGKVDDEAGPKE